MAACRVLNSKSCKDVFPLPHIEESLDGLSGAQWFSTLDLANGCNQVPVREKDHPKTAWLMERMFGAQHCQSLLQDLDDIIVVSLNVEELLRHLDIVLSQLQKEGLKAKL